MRTVRCLVIGILLSSTICTAGGPKANDAVSITSIPAGAQVEWNRKVIGTTPLTYKVGEYAFEVKKSSLFSKHLAAPIVVRLSKEGYNQPVAAVNPLVPENRLSVPAYLLRNPDGVLPQSWAIAI